MMSCALLDNKGFSERRYFYYYLLCSVSNARAISVFFNCMYKHPFTSVNNQMPCDFYGQPYDPALGGERDGIRDIDLDY